MLHNSIFYVLKQNVKKKWFTKFYRLSIHVHAGTKCGRKVVRIWVCEGEIFQWSVCHMTGHRSICRWFLGGEPQWPKTLKSLLPFHIVLARREKPISQWINGVILRSWTWLYSWSSAIDKGGTNTLTREQERLCTA